MSGSHSKPGAPPSAGGASGGANCPVDGGSPSCHDTQVKLVQVVEVVMVSGSPTRRPVVTSRKQYINLDDQVDISAPHPEYGRKIRLQARIEWVSGDKSRSLAGHQVYWKGVAAASNRSGLTGKERPGFDSAGSAALQKTTNTGADGWTPPVDFYLSLYGGDVFFVFATDKPDYSGGLPAGSYTIWRKFWYQVTEMDDGKGGVLALPSAVTNAFEAGYRTVFMEFSEKSPRNKAPYAWNLKDGTARANAAKPYFPVDSLCPFKAHIMTIHHSEPGPKLTELPQITLTTPKWVSLAWHLLWWDGAGSMPWKVSAQYRTTKPNPGAWTDIPNSIISVSPMSAQPGYYKITADFSSTTVKPTPAAPIELQVKINTNPVTAQGWGGGSHHLFLCTGFVNGYYVSGDRNPMQESDSVHEIGHALGLVNLKPVGAGTDGWEDTTHKNHCQKPPTECTMWYMSQTNRLTTFHLDGGVGCHDRLRRQDYSRSVMSDLWKD